MSQKQITVNFSNTCG